jgi:hypothetical protein
MRVRRLASLLAAGVALAATSGIAHAASLPPIRAHVDLMGKVRLSGVAPNRVTDVAVMNHMAYVGKWAVCPGGFWVVDLANPRRPREVRFVQAPAGTFHSEGMQALRLHTGNYEGDVLVTGNESCANGQGGLSIYSLDQPGNPVPLSIGHGDTDDTAPRAHSSHSVFAWNANGRAYAVLVDLEERQDVDLMEITDPRHPQLIAETGIDDWPGAQDSLARNEQTFVHDAIVRHVGGRYLMLVSYWDAGFVVLDVTDPAHPVYVKDSNSPAVDPLTGIAIPEGNAHEAEWDRCPTPAEALRGGGACKHSRYILGTDEDFSAYRSTLDIVGGPNAGTYTTGQFQWAGNMEGARQGPTLYGGSGCPGADLNSNAVDDRAEVPLASTLPAAVGEARVVVFQRGGCVVNDQLTTGALKGYDLVLVSNDHAGSQDGRLPNAPLCGGATQLVPDVPGFCIGHRAAHLIFDQAPGYMGASDLPPTGTHGEKVRLANGVFDGWGGLHLIDARTMARVDDYAIPEALDPRYSTGFGPLSVHEVATDPTAEVGYLSWYAGGFRVVDFSGGRLREVGSYVDPAGSNLWGVELDARRDGRQFVVASDRDYGLDVFRFGTDLRVRTRAPRRVLHGRTFTVTSTIRNDGTIAEPDARFAATLPRGAWILDVSASRGTRCTLGRRTVCLLGPMRENARAKVVMRIRVGHARLRRLVTSVHGTKVDYDLGSNVVSSAIRVVKTP